MKMYHELTLKSLVLHVEICMYKHIARNYSCLNIGFPWVIQTFFIHFHSKNNSISSRKMSLSKSQFQIQTCVKQFQHCVIIYFVIISLIFVIVTILFVPPCRWVVNHKKAILSYVIHFHTFVIQFHQRCIGLWPFCILPYESIEPTTYFIKTWQILMKKVGIWMT